MLGTSPKKKRTKDCKEAGSTSAVVTPNIPLNILPPLVLSSARHIKLSKTRNYVDVENCASKGSAGQLSVVRLFSPDKDDKPVWEVAVGSDVCGCVGTTDWVALACADATLRFLDGRGGTHLVPPVCLGAPPALLTHSAAHVVSMTTAVALTMWKVEGLRPEATLSPHSLASLVLPSGDLRVRECFVNETGEPVVAFSCGKAFLYSKALNNWLLIANSSDPVMGSTHLSYPGSLRSISPTEPLPLKAVQTATLNGLNTSSTRVSVGSEHGPMCTFTYLDSQISSARALNSKPEYKFWFLALVRFLVQHGLEHRLRSICEDLLGPTHSSANSRLSKWEPQVLGLDKRELLKEVLKEMSTTNKLQRLCNEIFSQIPDRSVKQE